MIAEPLTSRKHTVGKAKRLAFKITGAVISLPVRPFVHTGHKLSRPDEKWGCFVEPCYRGGVRPTKDRTERSRHEWPAQGLSFAHDAGSPGSCPCSRACPWTASAPADLRHCRHRADRLADDGRLTLRLPVVPGYDWDAVRAFLAARLLNRISLAASDHSGSQRGQRPMGGRVRNNLGNCRG